jgi:fumarate reductase (CoM/CoB) subunit B
MSKEIVNLQIYRFNPGEDQSVHYDEFKIPYSNGLTVLEGLIYIYENLDPSLSFRWSCKNVQCGTCGMLVNGKPVLACERQLLSGEKVKIDPFPLPIIKDLVTDFSSIEDKRVRAFSKPTPAGRPESLSPEEIIPLISLHQCLDCHICDIVCPLNKGKARIEPDSFLPADLVQLTSMVFNRREGEDRKAFSYSKKLYHCLTCGACVKACPVDIDIVNDGIERLRQKFMEVDGDPYRMLFDPKDWVERWVELKGQPFMDGAKEEYPVSHPRGRVGFFVGCIVNRRQQELAFSTIRTLNHAGFDVVVPKNQGCCGHPLMRIGMVGEARDLMRRHISLFESVGVSRVVTACPDCSFTFKEDYRRVVGNGDRKPRFEIVDLISLLPETGISKFKKAVCHNPCYLSQQGISLSDELIKRGIGIEEVIEACCGAGGGVYFTNPNIAQEVGQRTINSISSAIIITGCPFCKEQFSKVIDPGKRVVHYIELLDLQSSGKAIQ